MMKYFISIEAPKGELEDILDQLHEAQKTIKTCYERLEALGVLTFVEKNEVDSGWTYIGKNPTIRTGVIDLDSISDLSSELLDGADGEKKEGVKNCLF